MDTDTQPAAEAPSGIDAAFAEAGITDADFGAAPEPANEPANEPAEPVEQEAPSGPARDEHGRFKAKEEAAETPQQPEKAETVQEAEPAEIETPPGLSDAAKAAWKDTPEAVRADVQRRFREMEAGIKGYQADFGDLKEYVALAKSQGTTIKRALDNYVGIEKLLATDPAQAIKRIAANAGFDLAQLAAKPGEEQPQADQTIAALRREIAELKQGFGGVQQTLQQQREAQTYQQVQAFAASHPRFEELGETIAEILRTGFNGATTLDEAYALAERLNPAPQPQPQPAPQTRKPVANLSVAGAPGNGSNPTTRKPPAKIEDHLGEIFRQVGINS